MEPDADPSGREGMSIDQLVRARIQFALGQATALFGQVQFADAKAGTLLALIGLLAAHVASGGVGAGVWEMRGLLALNGVVIALCVAVLVPRVPKQAARLQLAEQDHFSWPPLSATESEAHAAFLQTARPSDMLTSLARANAAIARILAVKYALLGWAFGLAVLDVVATLLAASLRS